MMGTLSDGSVAQAHNEISHSETASTSDRRCLPAAYAVSVGEAVERHRVAGELAVDVHLGQGVGLEGVEAQLDLLSHQLGAHFEIAALPAHGAVEAHLARLAVKKTSSRFMPVGIERRCS
jgi:hypothetical protein